MLIVYQQPSSIVDALALLGWWPIGLVEICKCLLLTALLFTGPLFERGVAMGDWRDWVSGQGIKETLGGWIGWRNFVAVCSPFIHGTTVVKPALTFRARDLSPKK